MRARIAMDMNGVVVEDAVDDALAMNDDDCWWRRGVADRGNALRPSVPAIAED